MNLVFFPRPIFFSFRFGLKPLCETMMMKCTTESELEKYSTNPIDHLLTHPPFSLLFSRPFQTTSLASIHDDIINTDDAQRFDFIY